MTEIYLDLDNIVRVDMSSDGRHARAANVDRGLLEMGSILQRLASSVIRARLLRGLDTQRCLAGLNEVAEVRAGIRADARQRVDQH